MKECIGFSLLQFIQAETCLYYIGKKKKDDDDDNDDVM